MELVNECCVSRQNRISAGKVWKNYYFNGTENDAPSIYNRVYSHVDKLASYLFSPSEVRFRMDFESTIDPRFLQQGEFSSKLLSRAFHNSNTDIAFGEATKWSLIKGCCFVKMVWGHNGLEPWVVQPEQIGVLREDLNGLDRQEAFVHTMYLTESQFKRLISGNYDEAEILKKLSKRGGDKGLEGEDDGLHTLVLGGFGGNQPPITLQGTSNPNVGSALMFGSPAPQVTPNVVKKMIKLHELWVLDDERGDYTTFQLIDAEIVVYGKNKHTNLLNPYNEESGLKGEHPFRMVCANQVNGYFWGRSEVANIWTLQKNLTTRMNEIDRLSRLRANPPRYATGMSSLTEQGYDAWNSPGGFISEPTPNGTMKAESPEMPPELFAEVDKLVSYFDDVGGFTPTTQGRGESGVRSGVHADTLLRTSTPRLRDRALLVERQCAELGDLSFKLMQAKDARKYTVKEGNEYLLSQLPEDYMVTVDSHTSSPAFSEESKDLAFMLQKAGAIDAKALIQLTHPPMEDTLVIQAEQKAKSDSEMLEKAQKSDPGFLSKFLSKGKR